MKKTITVLLLVVLSGFLYTLDLGVDPEDIVITQEINSRYHLWIRQKDDMASVLLTESTANPVKMEPVYALRNPQYHALNGDEMRILNNKFLDPEKNLYSLIDFTPEIHPDLGDSFHILQLGSTLVDTTGYGVEGSSQSSHFIPARYINLLAVLPLSECPGAALL